jgi:hypothetical protein
VIAAGFACAGNAPSAREKERVKKAHNNKLAHPKSQFGRDLFVYTGYLLEQLSEKAEIPLLFAYDWD